MTPEDLITSIEEAFAGLDRPSVEEMAAAGTDVDQSFLDGVGAMTWQELRPLRRFVGDGGEIALLSAKAYCYYLPAYLVALVDEAGEEFYLNGVLDSLWCEGREPSEDSPIKDYFDPRKGLDEALNELAAEMPYLTDQEKMAAAEMRVGVAQKLAYVKEITGYDWQDGASLLPYRRTQWEERIPLLTDPQKRCITRVLVRVLERTTDWVVAPRIQTARDAYWGAVLEVPGGL